MDCPKCKDKMVWVSDFDLEDDEIQDGIQSFYTCRNKNCDVQEVIISTYSYYNVENKSS